MTVSIRLDSEMEIRLSNLAMQTGRTKSHYLRMFIESGLGDIEDFYMADAIMKRISKGNELIYDAAQVRKSLA
jgi:RHH-type rel operon transcriptional repressor/antitoxin RelB